ncbi:Structural maintenance of chromosomes protein 5 [Araneus ventricosus]|uniref:Structural maintenance of chromosomes protein 5 n=1 Tax=Araneus ventricosus TaxID=182803 RepID=A0A4Y2JHK0_ARAVE|nr:Structural maintenance of chromosomes protein 5 [Araneus ventricosus]
MANKVGGRIVRIKLKGFMTYDDLEIKPDKGLNLIIGLNGSGKSSIMSAICLGLGGKPQFTGRAVQLSDFIKYSHTKAIVEIELESPHSRNDVICRVIQVDKHLWYLNNKLVHQNEITSLIKKYNIDTSNLCQFLPQEKVAEFSKMDKKQRLVNMIQAIGDPSLVTLFDELKTLRNDLCRFERDLEELESNKISEEKMNERLKPEIDKHEERQQLKIELDILQFKRMVCHYSVLQDSVKKKEAERKQLNLEVLKMEETSNKLKDEKRRYSSELSNYLTKVNELKTEVSSRMKNLTKYYGNLGKCHEEIDNAKINFENRMLEKQEQTAKLTALSRQIEGLKDILSLKKDDMRALKEKLMENIKKYESVHQQLSCCDSDLERVNLDKNALEYRKKFKQEEIYRISNEEDKKYEVLRQKYPDTYTALKWLQQNESSFRACISPPPLVSIKVEKDENRRFIENAVADRDLLMFVCEDKGDLERFVKIIKHEKKLCVNVSMVPDESLADFSSRPITNNMRNLGIHCYLKDLFTAPEPVMRFLCKLNRVHQVPVCTEKAESNVDTILKFSNLFFTASEKIMGKRSKYGQQSMSVRRDVLISRNILPNIKDNTAALHSAKMELQEIEKELLKYKQQYDALEKLRTQLERQQEQLRTEKNTINSEQRKLNDLRAKLGQITEIYDKKAKDIIDEEEEKNKVTVAVCNLNAKKLEILTEIHKIVKEILHLKKEIATSILYMRGFGEKISSLEVKISYQEKQLQNAKSRLSVVESEKIRIKAEGVKLFADLQAKKKSSKNVKEYEMVVSSQNLDLEEIEQRISNIEAQIELTDEDIAPIIAEYTKRKQAILSIEEQLNSIKAMVEDLKMRLQEKKRRWLPPLITHIESVNRKFSKYYKILKCAGEISLDQTDDTDDFPNYGLQIKLKYRVNEEFMELSQTHHSGGECSVAAIIFILSLQELTDVPFRCIDEINQGMDAINERNIYQLVADAARSGSCSQYFLLTPKWLHGKRKAMPFAVPMIWREPTNHIDCYFCMVPPASEDSPRKRRDASKPSLKAVLLNNGNELPSIPVSDAVYMKETYHNLKQLLEMINYSKYGWQIRADLKVVPLFMGLQLGYTKYFCFLSLRDSRAIALQYIKRDWPQRASFKPGEMNVEHPPLAEQHKIIIPLLHIKLDLVKNLVKPMDKNEPAFKYLHEKFPRLSVAKMKEVVFVGPQIK